MEILSQAKVGEMLVETRMLTSCKGQPYDVNASIRVAEKAAPAPNPGRGDQLAGLRKLHSF